MEIKINITPEILKESMFCNIDNNVGTNCAIGRAICNLFGQHAWVNNGSIFIYKDKPVFDGRGLKIHMGKIARIGFPNRISKFIKQFDMSSPEQREKMSPTSFKIKVPNEVIDLIGIGQVYKELSESKTLELVKI